MFVAQQAWDMVQLDLLLESEAVILELVLKYCELFGLFPAMDENEQQLFPLVIRYWNHLELQCLPSLDVVFVFFNLSSSTFEDKTLASDRQKIDPNMFSNQIRTILDVIHVNTTAGIAKNMS